MQSVRGQKKPRALFSSVTFTVAPGENLAIAGPPGAGLAALARTLGLIQLPTAGRMLLAGQDISRTRGGKLRALRRSLQYVSGAARQALSPHRSLYDILAEPLQVHRLGRPAEQRAQIEAAADAWGLNHRLLAARPNELSAALCQRAALARACLLRPRLLVCEEPAARLEPAAAAGLLARIAAVGRAMGTAVLWTTTDTALAAAHAGRVLWLGPTGLEPLANAEALAQAS